MNLSETLLDLEVVELERRGRPGCGTSTTLPRCTCWPANRPEEEEEAR
jgi:hypothetical protein